MTVILEDLCTINIRYDIERIFNLIIFPEKSCPTTGLQFQSELYNVKIRIVRNIDLISKKRKETLA